ncbi:MAG: hypothetical protein DWP97_07830 [Calditrichaeota bacterium]|nr:MAG: hypothetical protein DWP97_07830 [Calditrichota bacterium]
MPTSDKQIKANQQNALVSTGPKTEEGKAIVAQNAVKDGLTANNIVLNSKHYSENQEEYEEHYAMMISVLAPSTHFQKIIAKKITDCLWRSNRIIKAETAKINRQLEDIESEYRYEKLERYFSEFSEEEKSADPEYIQKMENIIGLELIPNDSYAKRLLKYEIRLERQLIRLYKLYKMLQIENHFQSLQKDYKISEKDKTNPFENFGDFQ